MQAGARSILPAASTAGASCGFLFGLVDGALAWAATSAELTALDAFGCLAAAAFQYMLLGAAAGLLGALCCALVASRWLAVDPGARSFGLVLAGFLFVEAWWRTRPLFFYGLPATSPQRLVVAGLLLAASLLVARLVRDRVSSLARSGGRLLLAPVVLVGLAGGVFLLARGGGVGARGELGPDDAKAPNILLVVVDALRLDTLGCYGDARVRSPHIDRLAREGVLFENHHTQAPFTWTSFGSTLTGKYPRRHGLVRMEPGRRMLPNTTIASWLKSAPRSAGGAFEEDDWLSATFHTGTLSTGSGLLRGFDVYYEELAGHDLVVVGDAWSQFRSDVLLWILATKVEQKLSGGVATEARDWLEEHADRRFFAMVHLYSTHTPYDPPAKFRAMYEDPEYKGPVKAFYAQHREMIERGEAKLTPQDEAQIRNLYYAGVTQADEAIGELVETLRAKGVLDRTLVVVTSDHGESLGEQGLWEHNHMVQTNLLIPLVMRLPGALEAGRRVAAITDSIDLLPTVCELVGAELPPQAEARDVIDGRSLLPLVRGDAASLREYSYSENGLWTTIRSLRWKLWVPARAMDSATVLDPTAADRARLFDLEADPMEERDVLAGHPEVAAKLLADLRGWDATMPIPKDEVLLSPREIEALRERFGALGYADGIGGGK
jgi:arylsulfatase A-like enzyme